MSRQPSRGVLIAVVAFILLAAAVRFFGGSLFNALLALHGKGGGGH